LVGKKRKVGGFGQKAFFLLWLAPRSEAGEGSGGGGPPASRPRLRSARGGKGGGRRGGSSPSLTLGRGGARRWLHGRRRTGGGGARGRRRSSAQARGGGDRGEVWRPGERPTPFIGGKGGSSRDPRAWEASTMAVGKISPLTFFRQGCGRNSRWGCGAV
jgi:hypothetical protein